VEVRIARRSAGRRLLGRVRAAQPAAAADSETLGGPQPIPATSKRRIVSTTCAHCSPSPPTSRTQRSSITQAAASSAPSTTKSGPNTPHTPGPRSRSTPSQPTNATRYQHAAAANTVELAHTPHDASWQDRIEPQLKGTRNLSLNGTDHPHHTTRIARNTDRRNNHRDDPKLHHHTRPLIAHPITA
jgi:hypothetical protein